MNTMVQNLRGPDVIGVRVEGNKIYHNRTAMADHTTLACGLMTNQRQERLISKCNLTE